MVEIKGLQKASLIDYPGRVCTVVFLPGCNLRCPFCQNPDLVLNPGSLPGMTEGDFFEFLESRRKWLDGVCITGGEPCLHKGLPEFVKGIRDRGFLVKLDTNGTDPGMLRGLLERGLLDYVAMDLKAPLGKYGKVSGVGVDTGKIRESIGLVRGSGLEYEFRSTVLPRLHSREDILGMAELIKGSRAYFLQQFSPKTTLDPEFRRERPFTEEELRGIQGGCNKFVRTEVRI